MMVELALGKIKKTLKILFGYIQTRFNEKCDLTEAKSHFSMRTFNLTQTTFSKGLLA